MKAWSSCSVNSFRTFPLKRICVSSRSYLHPVSGTNISKTSPAARTRRPFTAGNFSAGYAISYCSDVNMNGSVKQWLADRSHNERFRCNPGIPLPAHGSRFVSHHIGRSQSARPGTWSGQAKYSTWENLIGEGFRRPQRLETLLLSRADWKSSRDPSSVRPPSHRPGRPPHRGGFSLRSVYLFTRTQFSRPTIPKDSPATVPLIRVPSLSATKRESEPSGISSAISQATYLV